MNRKGSLIFKDLIMPIVVGVGAGFFAGYLSSNWQVGLGAFIEGF